MTEVIYSKRNETEAEYRDKIAEVKKDQLRRSMGKERFERLYEQAKSFFELRKTEIHKSKHLNTPKS